MKLIQEQIEATRTVSEEIRELQGIVKDAPSKAQALIEYVNTLSKETLLAKRIISRTDTVILAQKWVNKNRLIMAAQANNAQMQRKIRSDREAFDSLSRYGFPSPFDMQGNLHTWREFDKLLINVGMNSHDIDTAKTPITASEANKVLRNDYTAHFKVREMCRELGTPNYTDLTELEVAIKAAKDYHLPNKTEWNNLAPVVLDALSFKMASQPFRPPPLQKQPPEASTEAHRQPTEQEVTDKKKKKQSTEQGAPSKKKKPPKQTQPMQ
jgi:hypothetical protein